MRLETERLILRRWKSTDAEPYSKLNSDPAVMEFMTKRLSREESDAQIARIEAHFSEHGFGLWAVELKTTGEFIGFAGLSHPAFEAHFTPCVEIGWRLARAHWGRGFATEAARSALAFGFEVSGLEEIVAFTVPANKRSIGVMERLEMKRDPKDDFERPNIPAGHTLRPHILYRMKRKEYVKGR
jgi:RimJ/RimL family protein N-acetyltransferase